MSSEAKPVHKNRKYPWEQWMDGKEHVLKQGKDFPETIAPGVMRGMALRKAYDAGVECETSVKDTTVTIKFGGAKQRGTGAKKAPATKPTKKAAAKQPAKKRDYKAEREKRAAKKAAAAAAS